MFANSILYVGGLHPDGTSHSRYKALCKFSNDVDVIDNRPSHTLLKRILIKYFPAKLQNIDAKIKKKLLEKKYRYIWIDKPIMISAKLLEELRGQQYRITTVAHITDDLNQVKKYNIEIERILSKFDYVFTCSKVNMKEYPAINFIYNELAYDSNVFNCEGEKREVSNEICFVGHYEKYYENQLLNICNAIQGTKYKLRILGTGWWRCWRLQLKGNVHIVSKWITQKEMVDIYKRSRVGVALYSETNRNATSGRIFEITALGVPILVRSNDIIRKLLSENYIEMEVVSQCEQFARMLNDEKFLETTAKKANTALKLAKCSWEDRVREVLIEIGFWRERA